MVWQLEYQMELKQHGLVPLDLHFSFFNSNSPFLHRMAFHISVSCDFFSGPNLNALHGGDVGQTKCVI